MDRKKEATLGVSSTQGGGAERVMTGHVSAPIIPNQEPGCQGGITLRELEPVIEDMEKLAGDITNLKELLWVVTNYVTEMMEETPARVVTLCSLHAVIDGIADKARQAEDLFGWLQRLCKAGELRPPLSWQAAQFARGMTRLPRALACVEHLVLTDGTCYSNGYVKYDAPILSPEEIEQVWKTLEKGVRA